jgi:hypothetical protein
MKIKNSVLTVDCDNELTIQTLATNYITSIPSEETATMRQCLSPTTAPTRTHPRHPFAKYGRSVGDAEWVENLDHPTFRQIRIQF